jgi:hypothetical protein
LKHFIFDELTLQETARYWVDSGIKTELDDDLIELNEQFFETIQVENQYGDFLKEKRKLLILVYARMVLIFQM